MNIFALLSFAFLLPIFSIFGQRTKKILEANNSKFQYALTIPKGFDKGKNYPLILLPGEVNEPNIYIEGKGSNHGWVTVESPINIESPDLFPALISQIKKEVMISSITIVGFSANSSGAFRIAAKYPNLVNSVVGMPGHPRSTANLSQFSNMSILFIVGEKDSYWLKEAKRFHQLFQEMNIKSELEIIVGGGHILHEIKGEPFFKLIEHLKIPF